MPHDPARPTGDPAVHDLVRAHLLGAWTATLCTTATQRAIEGFPFGSVVPYALDAAGRPVVLLAEIASHTANLRRDPRATLFVRQDDLVGDPQAGWRVSVVGRMERVPADRPEVEELAARYAERVPGSARYRETHDFAFWRMSEVVKVRYIGGFGAIHWVDGHRVLRDPEALADVAAGAVAHMNADHVDAMRALCVGLCGFDPEDVALVGLDAAGLQLRTRGPERLVHLSFAREVRPEGLRHAVVELVHRARAAVA